MRIKRLSVDESDETLAAGSADEPEVGAEADGSAVVTSEQSDSLTDTGEAPTPEYTTEQWGEYTNYRCVHCPYSTLSRDAIEAHVVLHRAEQEVAQWRIE